MIVLAVLVIACVVFRLLGAAGVHRFATWRGAVVHALAVMFLFTATAHFNAMRHDLARMTPAWVPEPMAVVYVTGILEILGAIGLMIPATRRTAGIALILFLIAVFPANYKAAQEGVGMGGRAPTPLVLRLPMQVLFIGLLAAFAVRGTGSNEVANAATQGRR